VFGNGEALTSDSIVRFRERAEVETSSSSMDTKCTTSVTRRTVPTGNAASSRADRSKPSLARIRGDVGGVCPVRSRRSGDLGRDQRALPLEEVLHEQARSRSVA
jgi:hypothetical protein